MGMSSGCVLALWVRQSDGPLWRGLRGRLGLSSRQMGGTLGLASSRPSSLASSVQADEAGGLPGPLCRMSALTLAESLALRSLVPVFFRLPPGAAVPTVGRGCARYCWAEEQW